MAPNSAIFRPRTPSFFALVVERAVAWVNHDGGLGNTVGAVVDEAVQIVALAHVSEEVFLRPSAEHGRRQNCPGPAIIRGKESRLVTTGGQLAELAHPQSVAQPGFPLGELDGGALARG
jgi:hypothetical protein